MTTKTTQMSMKLLRDRGYLPTIVEYFNAYARRKFDLFGFIDIVALHPDKPGLLGIQTTDGSHLQERVQKANGLEAYDLWLRSGNPIEFHGWRKLKGRWVPRVIRVDYSLLA